MTNNKIYIVKTSDDYGRYMAYFINKEDAEKYFAEYNERTTNSFGITSDSVIIEEVEIGKFREY